jgi:perosamine synthetase
MYGVVLDPKLGIDAVEFAKRLQASGIATRPFFLGMHQQPIFHDMGLFNNETYPITEKIAKFGLYLPSGLTLTEKDIIIVTDTVKKVLNT